MALVNEKTWDILALLFGVVIALLAGFTYHTYIGVLEHFRPGCFDDYWGNFMNWVSTVLFGLLLGFFTAIYIRVMWEKSARASTWR